MTRTPNTASATKAPKVDFKGAVKGFLTSGKTLRTRLLALREHYGDWDFMLLDQEFFSESVKAAPELLQVIRRLMKDDGLTVSKPKGCETWVIAEPRKRAPNKKKKTGVEGESATTEKSGDSAMYVGKDATPAQCLAQAEAWINAVRRNGQSIGMTDSQLAALQRAATICGKALDRLNG